MSSIEGLLLDIDGVLAVSWKPLPGAVEAIATLRADGVPFRLITNTMTHTPHAASPPTTHFTHGGSPPNVRLSVTTTTTRHTANTFTGRRMPRCSSQSRTSLPNTGDRFSHRSSRGDDFEK